LVLESEYSTIESNRIWLSGNYAPYPRSAKVLNWPGALSLREGHHSLVKGNEVFNNWGEGILPMDTHDIVIEDNVVYDNFAVNIYLATVGYPTVQRNLVYSTNSAPFLRTGHPASGIVLATEPEEDKDFATNQVIVNNIVVGNRQNIAWWGPGRHGALINALIANNTLVNATANDSSASNLYIFPTPAHENVVIENNIILQNTPGAIANVPNDPAFSFRNNLWSAKPPRRASGPGDIVADPELVRPDATLEPGAVKPGWYKIGRSSPAVGASRFRSEVLDDFFGTRRRVHPDMGAHEIPGTTAEPQVVDRVDAGCGLPLVGAIVALAEERRRHCSRGRGDGSS
jgi:parallel beta-helix repeat protein